MSARARVIITGASGFVGSYLVEELIRAGWSVWALSRSGGAVDGARPARVDMREMEQVRHALQEARPRAIVHLAAQSSVAVSYKDPVETLRNNFLSAVNLFYAACELDEMPRVLAIGSGEEYGSVASEDMPISEEQPLAPESPYGVSKAAQGLLALSLYRGEGLPTIIIRSFNHTGPRQEARFVIPAFARQIARIEAGLDEPVLRVGNLDSMRDFTDVRDIVRAYRLAIEAAEPGQAYNLGSGRAIRIRHILEKLLELSTAKISVELDPVKLKPYDIPEMRADPTKFIRATGWQLRVPLEQTLKDMLRYWRHQVTQDLRANPQRSKYR